MKWYASRHRNQHAMGIMKKLLLVIFLAILCTMVFAATKPDSFRYERSITINASAKKIFPYVNDYKLGQQWSPWEKMDPDMKRSFDGPESGKGAKYAWEGDHNIGKGNMEITESVPNKKVVSRLEFEEPMPGVNTAEFTLEPVKEGGTKVTWAMYGPNPFMGKLVSVFIDCEKMVTDQFEIGLKNLKTIVEK